jgi:hypothetical protein
VATTPGDQPEPPRHLQPAAPTDPPQPPAAPSGGRGPQDAGRIVDSLKASSEQEFHIAERRAPLSLLAPEGATSTIRDATTTILADILVG